MNYRGLASKNPPFQLKFAANSEAAWAQHFDLMRLENLGIRMSEHTISPATACCVRTRCSDYS